MYPPEKSSRATLQLLLKVCMLWMSRSSRGRAFHINLGAATWKDPTPSVTLILNVDDVSKIPPDDINLRLYAPCDFKEIKFWMYVGAILALNAKILKWIRCFDESQRSSYINGVIWLKRGAQPTNLAAVFKTRWTLLSCDAGRPYKRLLQ